MQSASKNEAELFQIVLGRSSINVLKRNPATLPAMYSDRVLVEIQPLSG